MDEILEGLNHEQMEAVKHFKGPLLILAGAGSGKTRVLTHRIAYLIDHYDINPYHILALTFTNKAAGEMRERVDRIVGYGAEAIWVTTFHSTCVRILRRYIEALGYKRSFTIYDADDQRSLMKEIIKYLQLDPKKYKERAFLNAISSAKDELISPEDYEARCAYDQTQKLYARAYREYEKRLKDANALDFDDLIVKTVQLLREHKDVLDYYQNRFRYILVDEYQDTNTAQFELVRLLASTRGEDGSIEHNLCVVGDDDQSIYKFRGANIMNILSFEKTFPDTRIIRLEQNYRSTQNILDAANAVIKHNTKRKEKALWTEKDAGDSLYFARYENEYEEADAIAAAISSAVSSGEASYKDFAVLYRTNAQSRVFEEKLINYNIPYRIVGAINFYQRKEIKDILAYLRTIANGEDDISVKRIINVPKRGIGLTTIDRVSDYAATHGISFYNALMDAEYIDNIGRSLSKLHSFTDLIESLRLALDGGGLSMEEIVRRVVSDTGYQEMLEAEDTDEAVGRMENIEELINKAASFDEETDSDEDPATLSRFLEDVALVADIDTLEEETELVLLMTMHGAKGLEFPYVYMVGMEDGIFPGAMAVYGEDPEQAAEEMEEERRLCYVGITRAMKKLSLSCARSRFRNGEMKFNKPSRFIEEIPRHLFHRTDHTARAGYQARSKDSLPFQGSKQSDSVSFSFGNYGTGKTNASLLLNNPLISKGLPSSHQTKKGVQSGKAPVQRKASSYQTTGTVRGKKAGEPTRINYKVGDRVHHQRFGDGNVLSLQSSGTDYEVKVQFENGTTRKMMASFAKLKKI